MAARWRKQPMDKGLAGIMQGPRGLELRENDKLLIRVAPVLDRQRQPVAWYWYGVGGRNTHAEGLDFSTMEEAKAHADAAYRQWLKDQPPQSTP